MSFNYPHKIPLLISNNQVLMPDGLITLTVSNISEIKMLSHILENDSIVGVVLKKGKDCFKMGCAGHVENIHYTDSEYALTLNGFKRFLIRRKKLSPFLYWQAFVSWDAENKQTQDFSQQEHDRLAHTITAYLKKSNNTENPQNDDNLINQPIDLLINNNELLNSFKPLEKQALLESKDLKSRYELIMSLMSMRIKQTHPNSQYTFN